MEKPGPRLPENRVPDARVIEMNLDGEFVAPPPSGPARMPFSTRVMVWAILAAVVGGAFLIAALALWFVTMILPFVIGAAVVAYAAYRWQVWRAGHAMVRRRGPGGW